MADVGRPTVMTPEVLAKLEEAFAIGCTDGEAIFYAGISKDAFYDYQKATEGYSERKEALKERPVLKARMTIVKGLDNPENAKWYLERKKKAEFAQRTEQTGADGSLIQLGVIMLPTKDDNTLATTTETSPSIEE